MAATVRGEQIREVVDARVATNEAARDEAHAKIQEPIPGAREAEAAMDEVRAAAEAMQERIRQGNPPSPEDLAELDERAKPVLEAVRRVQLAGLGASREHNVRSKELLGELRSLRLIEIDTVRFVEQHPDDEELARRAMWTLVEKGEPGAAGVLDDLVALDPWWTRPPSDPGDHG